MERNINIFFSLVFTIATTFNAFAQVSKVEVTTSNIESELLPVKKSIELYGQKTFK